MSTNNILILLIIGCCIILFLQIFSISFKNFFKFSSKCILSIMGFNFINSLLSSTTIFIGVNIFTVLFSALLGLPGFITLYIIQAMV